MWNDVLTAISGPLLQVVLPTLATTIGLFLVGLLNKQLQKAGLEVKIADKALFDSVVKDAIRATEESARRQPITSTEKRAETLHAVKAAAPEKPLAVVEATVDAQLPVVRAEASPLG